jgi:predicted  nucleic acid-binding Zn-ribbon protein
MTVADQLDKVIAKTERLMELCSALQEENDLLKLENQSLSSAVKVSKEKIDELEQKLKVIKMAKSFSETNEKTLDIKQKINEFVQEIDKCIVLLKK